MYTEPGSLIGSTGGGVLGYFTQGRTIVNLDGLINRVMNITSMMQEAGRVNILTRSVWITCTGRVMYWKKVSRTTTLSMAAPNISARWWGHR